MTATIFAYLINSKAAQAIGALLVGLLAWAGNSALQRRKGRLAERKAAQARDARAAIETTERMNDAATDLSDDSGVLRDWLRARDANKP